MKLLKFIFYLVFGIVLVVLNVFSRLLKNEK